MVFESIPKDFPYLKQLTIDLRIKEMSNTKVRKYKNYRKLYNKHCADKYINVFPKIFP